MKGRGKPATIPGASHAAAAATGIAVPLERGLPRQSARDIQQLLGIYS